MRTTTFAELKAKQRFDPLRDDRNYAVQVHRAISWIGRAEKEEAEKDSDAEFVFYWIAFNAVYQAAFEDIPAQGIKMRTPEIDKHREYFKKLLQLDTDNTITQTTINRYSHSIRMLLLNKYIYDPFWKHHCGNPGYADWERHLESSNRRGLAALLHGDTASSLVELFKRLYTLRNQIMHGNATWNGSYNRDPVRDGAAIMRILIPTFIDIMLDHPDEIEWNPPRYIA